MSYSLLTPSINAICKAGGEAMHGAYKMPSRRKSIGRRQMRKSLEKQGFTKEQAQVALKDMGYSEPVKKGAQNNAEK
jgi:hypothetical protein